MSRADQIRGIKASNETKSVTKLKTEKGKK